MRNKLFSILTALFVALPFMTCSLPPGSLEEPLHDPQQEPQQGDLLDGVKVHPGKVNIHDVKFSTRWHTSLRWQVTSAFCSTIRRLMTNRTYLKGIQVEYGAWRLAQTERCLQVWVRTVPSVYGM